MSEERKVQVPINCTFSIDVDEIVKHIDFSDHAEDDLQETIKDSIENSGRIEEHLQQLISDVIENNWSHQIERGEEAYSMIENLDLTDFESFNDLAREVDDLVDEDEIKALWKEIFRLRKILEETARLFALWGSYEREEATPETLEFFGNRAM